MQSRRVTSKAFTLVEMLVVLALMSTILVMMLAGMLQLGESVGKTRKFIGSRQEVANFIHTCYSFCNRSLSAYFFDLDASPVVELDYLNRYKDLGDADASLNTLYLVQNTAGDTGFFKYDPTEKTINWIKDSSIPTASQEVLTGVYRIDYVDNSDTGKLPVFRFPHNLSLYDTSTAPPRPKFITFEFLKELHEPTAEIPEPLKVPVKLMAQLNAIED